MLFGYRNFKKKSRFLPVDKPRYVQVDSYKLSECEDSALVIVFLIQFQSVIKCQNFSPCTPKILRHFLNAMLLVILLWPAERSGLVFIANSLQNISFLFFCSTLDRKCNKNQQESDIGNTAKFPSSRLRLAHFATL